MVDDNKRTNRFPSNAAKKVLVLMALAPLLNACHGSSPASPAKFKAALQVYYDRHPACLALALTLPVEIEKSGIEPMQAQLLALAKAGVLTAVAKPANRIRYIVAPGQENVLHPEHDSFFGGMDLCFARRIIVKIDSFTAPSQVAGQTVSQVGYEFKLHGSAAWASSPAIVKAFPAIRAALRKPQARAVATMVLTPAGWRRQQTPR
ncbi:MAG: hypothetical protein GC166_15160 [Alphaproteobacteria bacterium]|nr:hypothetical protein [Alphaproteobacteria bacterium]